MNFIEEVLKQEPISNSVDETIAAAEMVMDKEIRDIEIRKKRAISYPSIGDQLDALFHAGVFPEDMATKIQAVKDKYPKGE